jgi:Acyclic terpene utilisation family protein AtuA
MTVEDKPNVVRVLVPAGVLGWGVSADEIEAGLALAPHAIAVDAGSTDSGPAYLATGRSKYGRQSVKRDLSLLMDARRRAGVPLLIGSCGTSGCDVAVDQTLEIAMEVARELGDALRIAVIYSEQDPKDLRARNAGGRVTPLPPAGPLDNASLEACTHIVALMGPEPYMAAIAAGADIILGGRTTDTAVLAAIPLMHGVDVAAAWHAAKIAECGGLCTIHPTSPGVMMSIDRDGFSIEPLSPQNRCTPETVSAHMLYENSDPFRLVEPGGVLDVTDADYRALDNRRVRVTGSRWETRPYTMKLEGAGGGPFQTIMLIGIEDPAVLEDVDGFLERMALGLRARLNRTLGAEAESIDISLRPYGWNAVSGRPVGGNAAPPREIGLMFIATAPTQALATEAARICNPLFFHFPVHEGQELPSYAFPFSPAEIERGEVFEFHLNHVVHTTSPSELVRTRWVEVPAITRIAARA